MGKTGWNLPRPAAVTTKMKACAAVTTRRGPGMDVLASSGPTKITPAAATAVSYEIKKRFTRRLFTLSRYTWACAREQATEYSHPDAAFSLSQAPRHARVLSAHRQLPEKVATTERRAKNSTPTGRARVTKTRLSGGLQGGVLILTGPLDSPRKTPRGRLGSSPASPAPPS